MNDTYRDITGCLKPTPVCLYIFSGISPPETRRHGHVPLVRRFKSRRILVKNVKPLRTLANVERFKIWKNL